MSVELALGLLGLALTGVGILVTYTSFEQRRARAASGADEFLRVLNHLRSRRNELAQQALVEQERWVVDPELPLLAKQGWVPGTPQLLEDVQLTYSTTDGAADVEVARRTASYLFRKMARSIEAYSQAVGQVSPPAVWFDGTSYRLVDVVADGVRPSHLVFSSTSYFETLDTSEVLAFESALWHLQGKRQITSGKYRAWLTDPFSLGSRAAGLGLNVLTVMRREDGSAGFFLHKRDSGKVASSMGTLHVTPAGEFQPHSDQLSVRQTDLDLTATIIREYAEEFLDTADAARDAGVAIDYQRDEPYRRFSEELNSGELRISLLCVGLDPLSWKPEACLVAVWSQPAFERALRDMSTEDAEGLKHVGTTAPEGGYTGIDLDASSVRAYLDQPELLPAGKACLALAWRWRRELGIAD